MSSNELVTALYSESVFELEVASKSVRGLELDTAFESLGYFKSVAAFKSTGWAAATFESADRFEPVAAFLLMYYHSQLQPSNGWVGRTWWLLLSLLAVQSQLQSSV